MKLTTAVLLTIALGLAAPAMAEVITCSSHDHERNYCRISTRGGVKLVHQESRAGCHFNDSWGYDRHGIWVANGCRAEFRVGYGGSERHHSIHHNHRSSDSVDWDDSSRWEREHRSDHLSKGEKVGAALAVGLIAAAAAKDRDNRHHDSVYKCESRNDRYQYCSVGPSFHRAEVRRQLSRSSCNYGRDWGYDRRGIWVNHGCRAEFWVR